MIRPEELAEARAAAERAGDDRRLLELRELELACRALPPVVDGARRGALLGADALATTWTGWDTGTGRRVLLRCARPRWRRDPVMLRRLARAPRTLPAGAAPVLRAPEWRPDGDWPHLRLALDGPLLGELEPADWPGETAFLARLLAAGLDALARLHAAGLRLGGDPARLLVAAPRAPWLAWLDPFAPSADPATEVAALGRAVAALDAEGTDPVGRLAASWAEAPPPSADDAGRLLREALASALADDRHRLAAAARARSRRAGLVRLRALVRRLARALPPPEGRWCLRAGRDAVLVLLASDGRRVVGGAAADPRARLLPEAWSPERGLDRAHARFLLRAWATRREGDEARRAEVQRRLGSDDRTAVLAVRWLRAAARLHAAERLVAAEARLRERAGR